MKTKPKSPPPETGAWRTITLDPLTKITVPMEFHQVESTIPAGFRIEWMQGKIGKESFEVSCGAGCGGKHLIVQIGSKGFVLDIAAHMETLLKLLKDGSV